ncbi:hypothetical protein M413DRAFT_125394 [Hebeloma cylindrosporum]|uniref:Protein kinase domain-containing protein n=1 Tax=Hebeloma cylindrosporum TaxID=76867 RepID=A0A0C3CH06_HEBCY|nr:hypothetical protein M413DRAFT_125394 [Hebeloma cylindrosporum h7]
MPPKLSYSTPKVVTRTSKEVIPLKPPSRPRQYRPDFRYYLQHAWAKAVVNDSTFMTLNCGRYERIGIRHRASQTLYLSALIDPVNIQDPHYGKLHIGLHMAIVQDVLERYELAISSEKNTSTKRPAVDAEIPPSKRRKGSDNSIPVDTDNQTEKHRETIANEVGARMVVLVNLQYGSYCSPAPASFVRLRPSCAPSLQPKPPSVGKRKAKYGAHEFFTLTLGEQRFRGATGVVHPASLELRVVLPSREMSTLKRDGLIVKLAFLPDQQKRLHHEFDIYLHLAQRGAKGVVVVHGLFSDPESGALALVMDDGGKSLRQRERERTGEIFPRQVTTSDEERKAFLEIIESIHKAGVRHRDITADNLVVDCNTGQAFIIDFDQAEIARPRTNYRVEVQCLEYLLEGQYMRMTYELYN